MPRELIFSRETGPFLNRLISEERRTYFDEIFNALKAEGKSFGEIIQTFHEQKDITDTEWTGLMIAMGFAEGRRFDVISAFSLN